MKDEVTVNVAGTVSMASHEVIVEGRHAAEIFEMARPPRDAELRGRDGQREALPPSPASGVIPERSAARELLADPEPAAPLSTVSAADEAAEPAEEPASEATPAIEAATATTELTTEE